MAAAPCLRSLKATLVAAASTTALFAAANWGLSSFVENDSDRILYYAILGFVTPLFPLYLSVLNAMKVWAVKRSLPNMQGHMDHGCLAIIILCPAYITYPASAGDQLGEHLGSYERVKDFKELDDKLCPLELRPSQATVIMSNTDDAAQDDTDAGAARQDVGDAQNVAAELVCLKLPDMSRTEWDADAAQERAALLRVGLAPKCKKLKFLRSRNRFQSVVTALQASGYMATVVQRMVQHLGVSPLEAFTAFLCIVVIIQLLIELYACSHYQCPLLLHLTAHQFRRFRDAPRHNIDFRQGRYLFILTIVLPCFLILGLSLYYFIHYLHACLICSLSALFFFLSQVIFLTVLILFDHFQDVDDIPGIILIPMFICSWGMYASSIILAVVATTLKWKTFHEPGRQNWFAWLLPHVSG